MTNQQCESCTMPIESGTYCVHCTDTEGNLFDFEETFQRMVQWTRRNDPKLALEEVERQTREFMRQRPAWKDHPSLSAEG